MKRVALTLFLASILCLPLGSSCRGTAPPGGEGDAGSTDDGGNGDATADSGSPQVTASFTFSPSAPVVGQPVLFSDTSVGAPTAWKWTFGDSATDTVRYPSHVYTAAGSYPVTLTAGNDRGPSTATQTVVVAPPSGNVRYAASPSSVHIQQAIDDASDGDTVQVPKGDATWTSNVTVPSTKGLRLMGAGIGNTNIDLANTYNIFLDTRQGNSPVRLSGFRFTNCPSPSLQINNYTVGAKDWRVDHCEWVNGVLGTQINVQGHTFGVIDNCTFRDCQRTFWIDGQVRPFDTTPPIQYPGAYSWTHPITVGGPDAVYIEDCTVHNTTASIFFNMRGGARAVFRHNTVTGLNGLETHSGCTPGYRNPRWIEIYENDFSLSGGTYWCGLFLRSTNGVVFKNTFAAGYQLPMRFDCETICNTNCTQPWTKTQAAVDALTYPAQDQIGAGMDKGWGTAQALNEAKLWIWENVRAGSPTTPEFSSCSKSAELIQLGRDYFLTAPPGYVPYTYPHPLRRD